MDVIYVLAALVLLLGALFKINHWGGARALLIIGMIFETIAFALSIYKNIKGKVNNH